MLRAKLAELGIAQFADAIVREGYQSVEDLADMDEAELVREAQALPSITKLANGVHEGAEALFELQHRQKEAANAVRAVQEYLHSTPAK